MKHINEVITEGAHLLLSSGCYSDYYIVGLFKAKSEINLDKLKIEFAETHQMLPANSQNNWKNKAQFQRKEFIQFLINKDLLQRISYYEFYTGDYGLMDLDDLKIYGREAMFLGNNAGIETDYL